MREDEKTPFNLRIRYKKPAFVPSIDLVTLIQERLPRPLPDLRRGPLDRQRVHLRTRRGRVIRHTFAARGHKATNSGKTNH